jgi:hypothetical protein
MAQSEFHPDIMDDAALDCDRFMKKHRVKQRIIRLLYDITGFLLRRGCDRLAWPFAWLGHVLDRQLLAQLHKKIGK